MRLALWLAVLVGCAKGQGIVEVRVTAQAGESVAEVDHFAVTVSARIDGTQRTSMSAVVDGPRTTIPPAFLFALRFDSQVSGNATLSVSARDGSDLEISSAQTVVVITPSEVNSASVLLPGNAAVEPDLATPRPPDLSQPAVCGDNVCEASEACSCSADCKEDNAAACQDGCDNDGDTYKDCNDFDCCPLVQCATGTSCGTRQACASAGSSCSTATCPAGTTCVIRTCDGVLECQYPDVHCYTVGGVSCPKVSLYDVCTQQSDCATSATCAAHGGTTLRCWPNARTAALGTSCPGDFCPSTGGATRECVNQGCDASNCTFGCELACTNMCPFGLTCKSGHCSD